MLARAQAEVETAIKERDAAVSRWDERVAQRKASVVKLQRELNDLKEQLSERKGPSKDRKTGNIKKKCGAKNFGKQRKTDVLFVRWRRSKRWVRDSDVCAIRELSESGNVGAIRELAKMTIETDHWWPGCGNTSPRCSGPIYKIPLYALIMMADHKTAKSTTLTSVASFMPLAMKAAQVDAAEPWAGPRSAEAGPLDLFNRIQQNE